MSAELKPCPFCGQSHTLKITAASELFADEDEEVPYMHSETYAVICDASKPGGPGGCGGQGGFQDNEANAITAWNRRPPASSERVALTDEAGFILASARDWFNRAMQGHHTGANKAYKRLKEQVDALAGKAVRQPLTCEQVRAIWVAGVDHGDDWQDVLGIARAIEAAHGITPRPDEAPGQIKIRTYCEDCGKSVSDEPDGIHTCSPQYGKEASQINPDSPAPLQGKEAGV